MYLPKKDQLLLQECYLKIISEWSAGDPEPMYASCKIEDIIETLKYWVNELKDDTLGELQDFQEWLEEAELTVNNPNRRKDFFRSLNASVLSDPSLVAYMLPNFGEIDGTAWKFYTVHYPDGEKYKIKLKEYTEDTFDDWDDSDNWKWE